MGVERSMSFFDFEQRKDEADSSKSAYFSSEFELEGQRGKYRCPQETVYRGRVGRSVCSGREAGIRRHSHPSAVFSISSSNVTLDLSVCKLIRP